MILFAGIPSEPPLALAIAAAERLGMPHLVLNQRSFSDVGLGLFQEDAGVRGSLWIGGAQYPLDAIAGFYARLVEPETLPEVRVPRRGGADPVALAQVRALVELLHCALDVATVPVINRPAAMGSNSSKPYQAQLIRSAGLLVPETVVTNDPDAVRSFHATHRRVVYKSTSGMRSIVREWAPEIGPDLARLRALPTQFQAFVPGVNVRVHVVGDVAIATEILSEAVDYRYGGRDGFEVRMRPCELPEQVEGAAVRLTARLGLAMSGIDLKRTPDGLWYCFEVNPAPAYSYFEELGGQPIASTLVEYLAKDR